jgi:hypothetical protein
VSVTNLYYKESEKVVQVEVSMFLDDLENALRSATGKEQLDITEDDPSVISTYIENYIKNNLEIIQGSKSLEMRFIGNEAELESQVMWCYFEIYKVKKLREFRVRNTLLFEEFDDQENIIHFRSMGHRTDSERTYKGKPWAAFEE